MDQWLRVARRRRGLFIGTMLVLAATFGWLAYMSIRTGSAAGGGYVATLVIRSLENGQERTIAMPFRYGAKPLWFPDGQSILVLARNDQNHAVLFKVNMRTGEVTPLINTGAQAPPAAAVSPDGNTAYVAAGRNATLTIFDLASGRRTDVDHPGAIEGLAASPDGRAIAFSSHIYSPNSARAYLCLADAEGSHVRTVFTTERQEGISLVGHVLGRQSSDVLRSRSKRGHDRDSEPTVAHRNRRRSVRGYGLVDSGSRDDRSEPRSAANSVWFRRISANRGLGARKPRSDVEAVSLIAPRGATRSSEPSFLCTMYSMKRYTVSKARERLADVLNEADRTGSVLIERGDVQYVITPKATSKRKVGKRSVIETVDSAIGEGQWRWEWTSKGARFTGRRARS